MAAPGPRASDRLRRTGPVAPECSGTSESEPNSAPREGVPQMSGPWARYGQEDANSANPQRTESPYLLGEQTPPTAELPSYGHDPGHPYDGGHGPVAAPPGRSRQSRGSLIMAVVVMVAIVIASIAILSSPSAPDTARLPAA